MLGVLGRERIVMGVWPSSHLMASRPLDRIECHRAEPGWGSSVACELSRAPQLGAGSLLWALLTSGSGHSLHGRPGHWGEFSSIPDPHPLASCDNHRCSQVSPSVWLPPPGLPYSSEVEPTNEPQAATCTGDRDPSEEVFRVPGAEGGPSVKRQSHKLRGVG